MNVLTLKCPSCGEPLHFNKVSERFECDRCHLSLDPLQDVFSPIDKKLPNGKSDWSLKAEVLTARLEKCKKVIV